MQAAADVDTAKKQAEAEKKLLLQQAQVQVKLLLQLEPSQLLAAAGIGLMSDETPSIQLKILRCACTLRRELKPVTFYYKEEYSPNPERKHHGFIAQEFLKVLPDATYVDEQSKALYRHSRSDRTSRACQSTT